MCSSIELFFLLKLPFTKLEVIYITLLLLRGYNNLISFRYEKAGCFLEGLMLTFR